MKIEILSKLIKDYMKKKYLSQEEFGIRCGISKAYISILVRGKDPNTNDSPHPSIDILKKLAYGMDMPINELLSLVEDASLFEKNYVEAYNVPVVTTIKDLQLVSSTGSIINTEKTEKIKVLTDYYKRKNTVAIRISDDSLSPEIKRNDIAIVWLNEPYANGDYVLTTSKHDDTLQCYKAIVGTGSTILIGSLLAGPIRVEDSSKVIILGKVVLVQRFS